MGLLASFPVSAAETAISKDAPIQYFLVARVKLGKNEQVLVSSEIKAVFLEAFKEQGFHMLSDMEPLLITKSLVRYNQVHVGGHLSAGIGTVHREVGEDGITQFTSDTGQDVTLKKNVDEVIWVLDKKKILDMSDKAGAKYVLIAEISLQRIYEPNAAKPTYNVSLEGSFLQADNGKTVISYEDSMVKLGTTPAEAAVGAAQYFGRKWAQQLSVK